MSTGELIEIGDGTHQTIVPGSSEAQQLLSVFWTKKLDEVKTMVPNFMKGQELPLARIKKIMKMDEDVKMISAEAPVLFSKACEIFISELSLRAWVHTEDNKRRTLQRNDIAMAISKFDQFDFLIDIVPRDEIKPAKRQDDGVRTTSMMPEQVQYYFQMVQQPNTNQQTTRQPAPQPVQIPQSLPATSQGMILANNTAQHAQPQVIQIQVPQGGQGIGQAIQLSSDQLEAIRRSISQGSNQPIIITQPVAQPEAPSPQKQPVYQQVQILQGQTPQQLFVPVSGHSGIMQAEGDQGHVETTLSNAVSVSL